jgi:hypothetical protein
MDDPLSVSESPPQAPPPAMSLAARLLNVFAIPGEVFAGVKTAHPAIANWLLPAILSALVSPLAAIVVLSQPSVQQQIRDQQTGLMAKQVKAGTLTKAQADSLMTLAEKVTVPIAATLTVFASFARLFWWALVLKLLARVFLRTRLNYLKLLEVAGLATMISVLGTAVTLLLTVKLGAVGTPGLGLAISDFDNARKSSVVLVAASASSIWVAWVMSVGLAKLADAPFLRAAWLVFAYWLLQETLLAGL